MFRLTPIFRTRQLASLVASAALVVGVAACGGDDDEAASTTAPATSPATTDAPATTAAATTVPATTQPAPTTGAPASTEPASSVPPATTAAADGAIDVPAEPDADPWLRSATEFGSQVGSSYRYTCPPTDVAPVDAATVWGVELYTSDSSVCWAAVHVGLITPAEGGSVVITIAPGEDAYQGAIGNGVTSLSYGAWGASFLFPDAPPGTGEFELSLESWGFTTVGLGVEVGETAEVVCAPDGPFGAVWGSDPYTGDSSICTAAVHAGLFDLAEGGAVTVEALGEQESFAGSEANGVTTMDYGAYGTSFTFVTD